MKLLRIFCFILFSISFRIVSAQNDTIKINSSFNLINHGFEKYYFSKEDLHIQKILTQKFKPRDSTNLSYVTGWVWVKFIVKNEVETNTFILSSTANQISGYYMYKPEEDGYVMTPAKQNHPEDGREIDSNLPAFILKLKSGETKTFYLKIRVEEEVVGCNFIIQDYKHFVAYNQINYLILGVYFGVLIIILIINIFYSIALKDSLFFVYSIYILSVFFVTLTFEGFFWKMISSPILAYHICYFTLRFWCDSLLFFTIRLVTLKKHNPLLSKLVFIFLFYHTVIMAFLQLTDAFNLRLELMGKWEFINFVATLVLIFTVIICSYKNNKYLFKYYIIGLGAILLSAIVFPLYTIGYLKDYIVTEHCIKIGTLVEIITLSFAVSRRFRITENDLKLKKEGELKLNEKVHELETNVRKAQMNPHFMFNALTSIEYYILKNNRKEACLYLEEFAQLMRLTLDNSRQSYIPLEDELKALKLYVDLEFLRLKENKHVFEIKLSEAIDPEDIVVPALLIQPFVENAILHGLQKKHSSGNLIIALRFEGNNLLCIIEDNGGGMNQNKKSTHKSSGMQITKERLLLIHGIQNTTYKFEVTDVVNEKDETIGTRVLFYMPYKKD